MYKRQDADDQAISRQICQLVRHVAERNVRGVRGAARFPLDVYKRQLVEDAGDNQVALEAGASVARSGVVDRAVEFLRDVKSK